MTVMTMIRCAAALQALQLCSRLLDAQAPKLWVSAAVAAAGPSADAALQHSLALVRELTVALRSCGQAGRPARKAVRQQVASALPFKAFARLVQQVEEQVEEQLQGLPQAKEQEEQQPEQLPRLGGLLVALDAFKHVAGNPKSKEQAADISTGMPSLKRHQIQLSAAAALAFNSPQLVRLLLALRPGPGGGGAAYSEALQLMSWGTARLFLFQTPPDCLAPAVLEAGLADMARFCCLPQVSCTTARCCMLLLSCNSIMCSCMVNVCRSQQHTTPLHMHHNMQSCIHSTTLMVASVMPLPQAAAPASCHRLLTARVRAAHTGRAIRSLHHSAPVPAGHICERHNQRGALPGLGQQRINGAAAVRADAAHGKAACQAGA
jgi:hypothetical protein